MRSPGSTSVGVRAVTSTRAGPGGGTHGPATASSPARANATAKRARARGQFIVSAGRVVDRAASRGRIRGVLRPRRAGDLRAILAPPSEAPMSVLTESPAWRALAAHRDAMLAVHVR